MIVVFNGVVVPNAQQELLAGTLLLAASLALLYRPKVSRVTIFVVLSSWLTTIFYLLIGQLKGASAEAVTQTVIIYILSPLIWLLVIDRAWTLLGTRLIIQSFAYLSLLACASVALYMYLFLNFGEGAVKFFGARANVHLEEGYSGVIMHVLGSLIFMGAAFASSPGVLRSRPLAFFVLFSLPLAIVVSGRTAAILGLAIGSLTFLASRPTWVLSKIFWIIPITIIMVFLVSTSMQVLLDVELFPLLERHFDKLANGDIERPAQMAALLRGAEENWFLGAGHGIGVDYIRSTSFPWRYEAVFVALLFKLGLVGSIIVLFPIIYSIAVFFFRLATHKLGQYDTFFGSALLAVTISGLTNPYPEAFAFQWMYLVPVYYFAKTSTIENLNLFGIKHFPSLPPLAE